MFHKISSPFILGTVDWKNLCGSKVAEFVSGTCTLRYFSISDFVSFRKIHCKNIFKIKPEKVMIATISGVGFLAPHKDHNTRVTLNHYISAAGDITEFYDVKPHARALRYRDKEQENVFDLNDLDVRGQFVARDNETYLLNVERVHSVMKVSTVDRVFIAYGWNEKSFDEIAESLQ